MADALIPVGKIYEGFWIDWTRNRLLGCTLTLCPTSTTVLTNSLAMWVTLCGIQLWTIIRYTLHQRGSSLQMEARTPHFSGQQIILRNTGSALTTAYRMLTWAWNTRSSTGQRSVRTLAIAVLAVVYAVAFTIAGMFSNNAIFAPPINGNSAVLLRNSRCGVWNQTIFEIVELKQYKDYAEFELFAQNAAKRAYEVQLSLEYAQECYIPPKTTTELSSTCRSLKQTALGSSSSSPASCPFAPQMCLEGSDAIVFDTGVLDSHEDFGINSVRHDRLNYRRITTCAVLDSATYVEGWNGTLASLNGPRPSPQAAHAYYGQALDRGTNWTYSYSNFASFYDNFSVDATTPYQVGVKEALAPTEPQWLDSEFDPIQEIAKETADITLIFLSFTGMYLGPVNDPWFLATEHYHFDSPLPFTQDRYSRDTAISTLGCTEQHKFCTTDNVCTDFLGYNQVQNNASFNTILTPHQNATFDRMIRAVQYSRIQNIVRFLAATTTPLLAAKGSFDGNSGVTISTVLPDNQWKLELEHWHSIALAELQRTVARWATGQVVAEPGFLVNATDPQDLWFCDSLIVPSAVYTSFSVFAIVLILVLGCLVIIAGMYVERIASLFRGCLRKSTPRRPWDRDDMIELQRRKTVTLHQRTSAANRTTTCYAASQSSSFGLGTGLRAQPVVTSDLGIADQSVPQRQYARLPRVKTRLTPSINRDTTYQPSSHFMRESWMPISLCSHKSDTSLEDPKANTFIRRQSRQVSVSRDFPYATTHYHETTAQYDPMHLRYPEWV